MEFFKRERSDDGILFIIIDNPGDRVNTITQRMFPELEDILGEATLDPSIEAMVFISGKKDNFFVGADIHEFDSITDPEQSTGIIQHLHSLFERITSLPFPVIAAINGPCVGGGLEFALACHFRIATDWPRTVLGLPEVRLGLFPAAGGTQRLTRLIGIKRALPLMLSGKTMDARRAKALGIVDLVVFPGDLMATASRTVPFFKKKFPRKTSRDGLFSMDRVLRDIPLARKAYFRIAKRQIQKQTRGNYPAPLRLLDCVEAGMAGTLRDGFNAEAQTFGPLVVSPQSKSMRSLFFLQTALKKTYFGTPRPVAHIGILGSGFMGAGIATVSASSGYRVTMKDISQDNLTKALGGIWNHFDRQIRVRGRNPVERDKLYSLITPALDYRALSRAGLVIEAVFEDLELKRRVIREVEAHISPECIFASNTSAIPISHIAEGSSRPQNVIGMHFFSPVPKMPLLEIVVTEHCAESTLATAVAVGRKQGKLVIVVKDGPGFYTTRILMPFMLEAIRLIEEGARVPDVDEAMRDFGFPVGPLKLMDEVGIEVATHVAREMSEFFSDRDLVIPTALDGLLKSGFTGRSKGLGFYDYRPKLRDKIKVPGFERPKPINPKIYTHLGTGRNMQLDVSLMQKRLVYLMVNEAALCLQEAVISGPEDGDIGAVFGIGFPPFLGGPFRYLDSIGAGRIVTEMEALESRLGSRFRPAPILVHMAEHEDRFYKKD